MTADLRGSYTLGFYAPEWADGKWHKLAESAREPDRCETAASPRGIPYARQWTPSPCAIAVRIVAVDMQTGRYGSLDVPIGEAR